MRALLLAAAVAALLGAVGGDHGTPSQWASQRATAPAAPRRDAALPESAARSLAAVEQRRGSALEAPAVLRTVGALSWVPPGWSRVRLGRRSCCFPRLHSTSPDAARAPPHPRV